MKHLHEIVQEERIEDPKGRDDSERRQVESGLGTSKFNGRGGAAIKRLAVTPRAVRSRPFLS